MFENISGTVHHNVTIGEDRNGKPLATWNIATVRVNTGQRTYHEFPIKGFTRPTSTGLFAGGRAMTYSFSRPSNADYLRRQFFTPDMRSEALWKRTLRIERINGQPAYTIDFQILGEDGNVADTLRAFVPVAACRDMLDGARRLARQLQQHFVAQLYAMYPKEQGAPQVDPEIPIDDEPLM